MRKRVREFIEEDISTITSSSRGLVENFKADSGTASCFTSSRQFAVSSSKTDWSGSGNTLTGELIDRIQSEIAKIDLEINAVSFVIKSFEDFIGKEEDARLNYLISQFELVPFLKTIYRDSIAQLLHKHSEQYGKLLNRQAGKLFIYWIQ